MKLSQNFNEWCISSLKLKNNTDAIYFFNEISKLEKQIEKMKCCENCMWYSSFMDENPKCNESKYNGLCGWKMKEDE